MNPVRENRLSALNLGILLVCTVFWIALLGVFDFVFGRDAWRQVRSTAFPVTSGVITSSQIVQKPGRKGGTIYEPTIAFDYTVNGQDYAGSNWRYGSGYWSGSNGEWYANTVVGRFPVGASVPVHYNPQSPSDAVLETGLQGRDLCLAMFFAPFHIAGIGFCVTIVSQCRLRWRERNAQMRSFFPENTVASNVDRLDISPLFWAAGALVLMTLVGSIVMVVFFAGNPPMFVIVPLWVTIMVVSFVVFVKKQAGEGARR